MSKEGFWKAARGLVFGATVLVGAANIGWNMYLLDNRPTISETVPVNQPDSWLCGKGNHGFGPVHCVLLSETDHRYNLWMQGSFLVIIPFFVALAFWKRSRREKD